MSHKAIKEVLSRYCINGAVARGSPMYQLAAHVVELEEEMTDRIQCPMYMHGIRCPGKLEKTDEDTTYLDIMTGVDDNEVTERFKCPVCGEVVKRRWRWGMRNG